MFKKELLKISYKNIGNSAIDTRFPVTTWKKGVFSFTAGCNFPKLYLGNCLSDRYEILGNCIGDDEEFKKMINLFNFWKLWKPWNLLSFQCWENWLFLITFFFLFVEYLENGEPYEKNCRHQNLRLLNILKNDYILVILRSMVNEIL